MINPKSTSELIAFLDSNQNYKNLIFDFDLTICHLKVNWTYWHNKMQEYLSSLNEMTDYTELGVHKLLENLIIKYGESARDKINSIFFEAETKHLVSVEDNIDLIEYIKMNKSCKNYILSNNITKTIELQLERIELLDRFESIVGRDKTDISKPNPDPILKIIEESGEDKDSFIMIGDNPGSDILAAERAEIDSFLIDMYL